MVLDKLMQRFFGREDKTFDFDNPNAYRQGEYEDCLSCRVVGSTALVSLGGYTYFSGMKALREKERAIELSKTMYKAGSRRLGIIILSGTLMSMGFYRMVN